MKPAILLGLAAALLATGSHAAPARYQINSDVFACEDMHYYAYVMDFAIDNDLDGFGRAMGDGVTSGLCRVFGRGEEVTIEPAANHFVCIRAAANQNCWFAFPYTVRTATEPR